MLLKELEKVAGRKLDPNKNIEMSLPLETYGPEKFIIPVKELMPKEKKSGKKEKKEEVQKVKQPEPANPEE